MPFGNVLYEPAMPINHIYFPTTSVISISRVMADGRADALALVGREGCASVEVFLTPHHAVPWYRAQARAINSSASC
jgi:hypothetical protein